MNIWKEDGLGAKKKALERQGLFGERLGRLVFEFAADEAGEPQQTSPEQPEGAWLRDSNCCYALVQTDVLGKLLPVGNVESELQGSAGSVRAIAKGSRHGAREHIGPIP
jgi:hypothetical protein